MAVVSDLVSYRFALVEEPNYTAHDRSKINSVLCRIPIEFIDDQEVIDAYRALGSGFNSVKLVQIVNVMVKAADPSRTRFDFNTLGAVPSAATIPTRIVIEGCR